MEHTVEIQKIIAGGKGLGRLSDGKVFMVDGVLTGELCLIREQRQRKGYVEATLIKLLSPSPARVTPPCPYYQDCGGCSLQHAAYDEQLEIKGRILTETLTRSRLDYSTDAVPVPLPSPEELFYRYRIRLHLDSAGRLGFHRVGSNSLVQIEKCLLATQMLNSAIQALAHHSPLTELAACFKAIELIHCPNTNDLSLILHQHTDEPLTTTTNTLHFEALKEVSDKIFIKNRHQLRALYRTSEPSPISQQFICADHHYQLKWSPDCFFQVNILQNLRLVHRALELLGDVEGQKVLDLFCGMGNFSIPLAMNGATITGIEHNTESINWAGFNARKAGLEHCTFICNDVDKQLRNLVKKGTHFDCILLDPPRRGLPKSSELLPLLMPEKILYISCDPVTLARDLKTLAGYNFRPVSIIPVDMFPQTHHLESITLLEKN